MHFAYFAPVDALNQVSLQEAAGDDWQFGDSPQQLHVQARLEGMLFQRFDSACRFGQAGQWLEMAVEFIAQLDMSMCPRRKDFVPLFADTPIEF